MSGSPLSQGAGDGSKSSSISPAVQAVEVKAISLPSTTAESQDMPAPMTSGLSGALNEYHSRASEHEAFPDGESRQLSYMINPLGPQGAVSPILCS